MATLTTTNLSFAVDETVGAVAFDEFVQTPAVMPAIYDQRGSSAFREVSGSVSGLGDFVEKTALQDPNEDSVVQQFKKEFIHKEFALQAKLERTLIDDQRFDLLGDLGMKIAESANRTIEKQAAQQFNEAFDNSSDYKAEDSLTLCNSAHLNVDSGNSQSNAGSTALSFDSAGTTRVAMRDFTDYRGNEIAVQPDMLIVPTALEQTAFEIVRSSGDPTEANLKANFHNGRYGVVVWDYLTDSDNWFMADSRMMAMNLRWYWRVPLEIYGDGDLFKGMRRIGGYYRSSHGVKDWRFIYGHDV